MYRRVLLTCAILSLVLLALLLSNSSSTLAATSIQGLHVSGNTILNGANEPIHLLGVNRSGGEFMCVQNRGIWDGPVDAASVQAMAAWHINIVGKEPEL